MKLRRIAKISAIVVGSLAGLAMLAAVGAAGWFWMTLKSNMRPPSEAPGVLANYIGEPAPANKPVSEPASRFDWNTISTPPRTAYPMVRWFWPGGAVEPSVLRGTLSAIRSAGYFGVEIQPMRLGTPAKDAQLMAKVFTFDTASYYDKLHGALQAARDLGMTVDITHFSGYPPGGPEVGLEQGVQQLVWGEATVKGGRMIERKLPEIAPRPHDYFLAFIEFFMGGDFGNFAKGHERALSTVAVPWLGGEHSGNPTVLDRTVVLDGKRAVVLDRFVRNGVLRWQAPAGKWQIVTTYVMPTGEPPLLSASAKPGYIGDPLRSELVAAHYNYAFGKRTGLPAFYGSPVRAIFNDSVEYTPTRWGALDVLSEFAKRRGYDLRPYLPAVHIEGVDDYYLRNVVAIYAAPSFRLSGQDARIRYDYQQTLSDLYVERFVDTTRQWTAARGLIARGQPYGHDFDIIRAMGGYDIPEVEQNDAGGSEVLLKMGSSGAALYSRNLVSAESFVWINREYTTVAPKMKAAADKMFLAGINHIVAHGAPNPLLNNSQTYGEEGWFPFSSPEGGGHFSENLSPANPLWRDLPGINQYIARSQNLLRQGKTKFDVLIYYPFLGLPLQYGSDKAPVDEPLIDGDFPPTNPAQVAKTRGSLLGAVMPKSVESDPRLAWLKRMQPVLKALTRRGLTWGWVNEHALVTGKIAANGRLAGGGSVGAILFAEAGAVAPEPLAAAAALKAAGLPVMFTGELPRQTPGFKDYVRRDAEVQRTVAAMTGKVGLNDPTALVEALASAVKPSLAYRGDSVIQRFVRKLEGGEIQFFANLTGKPATAILNAAPGPLWTYDAVRGEAHPAIVRDGTLALRLGPYESLFVVTGIPVPRWATAAPLETVARSWSLERWDLSAAGKHWPSFKLADWRSVDDLRYAGGAAQYRTCLSFRPETGARYRLDFGIVPGSASVRVNGRPVHSVPVPPAIVDVTADLNDGKNCIDVTYLPAQRNLFIGRALAKDRRYRQFNDRTDAIVPAGLVTPVVLKEITVGSK